MTASHKKSSAEIVNAYMKKFMLHSKNLNFNESKKIFMEALTDYFEGSIGETDFATVATELYYKFNKPEDFYKTPEMQELGNALSSAAEIDYYSKNKTKNPKLKKMYEAQIRNLKNYYENNK